MNFSKLQGLSLFTKVSGLINSQVLQDADAVFHVHDVTMGKLVGHGLQSLDALRADSGCQIWCELRGLGDYSTSAGRFGVRRIEVKGE